MHLTRNQAYGFISVSRVRIPLFPPCRIADSYSFDVNINLAVAKSYMRLETREASTKDG